MSLPHKKQNISVLFSIQHIPTIKAYKYCSKLLYQRLHVLLSTHHIAHFSLSTYFNYKSPQNIPSLMFFIFLFLTILSYVHAQSGVCEQSVLITCNAGCGCVTETGIAVACSFIEASETAVIRATKSPTGQFAAVRIVPIQSEGIVVQRQLSSQFTCPTKAGAAASDGYPMCNPIDSSSIPKSPVRMSGDVTKDLEPEHVEHFVSPIGNISLVVTRQIGIPSSCAISFSSRDHSVRHARVRQFVNDCFFTTKNPHSSTPPPKKPNQRAPKESCGICRASGQVNVNARSIP